jgi:hypothetical protein
MIALHPLSTPPGLNPVVSRSHQYPKRIRGSGKQISPFDGMRRNFH